MQKHYRRYLFTDFDNLRKVKFKKLEKVATKIFVFVHAGQEHIPLSLVLDAQKFGKNLRWILVEGAHSESPVFHIAFLMGKLHQKLHLDVEFAVLTNQKSLDPLIRFINDSGRSCLRVKRKKTPEEKAKKAAKTTQEIEENAGQVREYEAVTVESGANHFRDLPNDTHHDASFLIHEEPADELIEKTAEDIIQRLIRSGNRPAEVSTLKSYILLNNEEMSLFGNVDKVIKKLEDDKEIEIDNGFVIYHF
ncbi:MAG: hypothetical protein D6714_19640 [Bacteroidetes bacterium]|nr:MAG: hypothetical protein D6714_19640 [Bacteroidota bacterium]